MAAATTNTSGPSEPLTLTPILLEKVWGGDRLAAFGKAIEPGQTIGESWELADLTATTASGAGGGAFRSIVASGTYAGKSIGDLIASHQSAMLGNAQPSPEGGFPLLVKFLDATDDLSVQVHPSPAYCKLDPTAKLKTECWYILAAEPGAVIYKGIKPGVTAQQFAAHIADGTVVNDLIAVPAIAGDCHNLPSGTVHALGRGVLVAEVQTPSDTTFRVFDWGRVGRELHIEQALKCIEFAPAPLPTRTPPLATHRRLVSNDHFVLTEYRAGSEQCQLPSTEPNHPLVIIMLDGTITLETPNGAIATLTKGQTCLLPACIAADTRIINGPAKAHWLQARV